MPLRFLAALFAVYGLMVVIAISYAPFVAGEEVPRIVYIYLLKMSMSWAGLTWLSIAVYVSLISETDDYNDLVWMSFIMGAVMTYMGISMGVASNATNHWLGIRSLIYYLLSAIPYMWLRTMIKMGDIISPSDSIAECLSKASPKHFWPARKK